MLALDCHSGAILVAEKPSTGELLRQELNNLKAALDDASRASSGRGEDTVDAKSKTKEQDCKEEEK